MSILLETKLPLTLAYRGKIRDTFDLGDRLLLIATDRISAFDFVLPNGIPDKGLVLNQISSFWFKKTSHIMANHLIVSIDSKEALIQHLPEVADYSDQLIGRSMIVFKAKRIPIEAVVRGFLSGSALAEYTRSGTVSGVKQPDNIRESQEFTRPLFTPTTKADSGHDIPLSKNQIANLVGKRISQDIEEKSVTIYEFARKYALNKGVIIADTKFEFGFYNERLILIDELITPDSSRFWDVDKYEIGHPQPSYDKQPVRDWLEKSGWDKEPPIPVLPADVVQKTTDRYTLVFKKLTGHKLNK